MSGVQKLSEIVVVDQDEQTRRAAEAWLRREGYEAAVCVASGGAAVRFLDAYRPKFAVLDVTTLGADGLNVIEALRREPSLRGVSVVVHVAVPEIGSVDERSGEADATQFRSQAFLTNGINWPTMRAELDQYVH